ncbi:MAG TPA: biopolymer transporter ExbD [Opitutaceae bacterium]|nr:biopolymer transporter ExbD [Opitutaceae bacterium]
MPLKLGSKLPEQEARIEIIPLIDIMFFLLASFMLVSLSMVHLKSVKVNLPTSTTATTDTKKDLVNVTIDRDGLMFLDGKPIGRNELASEMARIHSEKPETRVFISGDRDARHGDVLSALDIIRSAGVQNVAFETRESSGATDGVRDEQRRHRHRPRQ